MFIPTFPISVGSQLVSFQNLLAACGYIEPFSFQPVLAVGVPTYQLAKRRRRRRRRQRIKFTLRRHRLRSVLVIKQGIPLLYD